ncbi:MAG TPA: hypothetical protein VJ583_03405, partial [Nitrososphaeraceae archaeon]|nr:hypothetical protein [Nitrososphaeraceae archaeon]
NDILKIIEFEGKKYYIPTGIVELITEFMAKCYYCGGIFSQNEISLYKIGYDKNGHVCHNCKKDHPELTEVVIK